MNFLVGTWKLIKKLFKPFLTLYNFLWKLFKKMWVLIKKNWGEIIGIVIVIAIMIVGLIYMANNIDFKDEKEKIRMFILYISMFTTFGGAYLGAKISGQNAKRLYENDLKIRDIENHMSANIKVLNEITNSKELIDEVRNTMYKPDFFYPYNLNKIRSNITSIKEVFSALEKETINKASLSINIDFDDLNHQTTELYNILKKEFFGEKQPDLKKFIDDDEELLSSEMWLYHQTNIGQKKIFLSVKKGNDILEKEVDMMEIYQNNQKIFSEKIVNIGVQVGEWINSYYNMEYKTKDDLKKVYKKVRN